MRRMYKPLAALAFFLAAGVLSKYAVPIRAAVSDLATLGYDSANNRDVIRVNSSGNLVPGADNTYALGTSSLRFSDIRCMTQTLSTTLTNSGNTVLGDSATGDSVVITASITVNGLVGGTVQRFGTASGAAGGIFISSQLVPTQNYVTAISSGGNLILTGTPTISTATALGGSTAWTDGTYLLITSTAAAGTITLQDNGTLSGSRVELGAATRAIGQGDMLRLIYNANLTSWYEVSFVDN